MGNYPKDVGPQWKAPRTLLPKVLKAVEVRAERESFLTVTNASRGLILLACGIIIVGMSLALAELPVTYSIKSTVTMIFFPLLWIYRFWTVLSVLQRTVLSILSTPTFAIAIIATFVTLTTVSTILIAGFSYLWRHESQRSFA